MTMKEKAARRRVMRARKELERAGAALLKVMKATDEEIALAADTVAELKHESDAEGYMGAEWNAIVADQVQWTRYDDAEQAEYERQEATAYEETRARQTGVSVEQLRKEAKEAE